MPTFLTAPPRAPEAESEHEVLLSDGLEAGDEHGGALEAGEEEGLDEELELDEGGGPDLEELEDVPAETPALPTGVSTEAPTEPLSGDTLAEALAPTEPPPAGADADTRALAGPCVPAGVLADCRAEAEPPVGTGALADWPSEIDPPLLPAEALADPCSLAGWLLPALADCPAPTEARSGGGECFLPGALRL